MAVFVLDKGDAAGAVWIVLDTNDRSGDIVFTTLEVDEAVVALVSTADMAGGDAASIITATAALERREEAFLWLAFGDLVEGREILVASGGCDWLESFQGHDNRNVEVLRLKLLG